MCYEKVKIFIFLLVFFEFTVYCQEYTRVGRLMSLILMPNLRGVS